MTKDELIAKLEQATEGSRELDAAIHEAIGSPGTDDPRLWAFERNCDYPPDYTTSLDAALTLVPDGWFWRVGRTTSFPTWAGVHKTHPDHGQPNENEFFWKRENWEPLSTPALALCIASLKARA